MSGKNWEDFLTGKDGDDDDQHDEENESPMSSLKLPGSRSASNGSLSAMTADTKPKVETLEEKIARVMAGINMPKLDSQKSVIAGVAGRKTPSDRSINSEPSQSVPQVPSPASLPSDAKDSTAADASTKGRAKIVKLLGSNSLSSSSSADDGGILKAGENDHGEDITAKSGGINSPPPGTSLPAKPSNDSDSDASSVRRGARVVKPSNIASDPGLPVAAASPGSSSMMRKVTSHAGPITADASSSPPPEPTATTPIAIAKGEWSEEVDVAAGMNGEGRAASPAGANAAENSPVAPAPLSTYNPEECVSPTSEITDADSQAGRVRSQSVTRIEVSARGNSRDSARSTNPGAEDATPARPPARVASQPFTVAASTTVPTRPKSAPRPSAVSTKTPAVTAFTPQQRRIPDKDSALSAMGLAGGAANTPDTTRRRTSNRDTKEVWSVTKRAQLDSSYATPGAGRALVATGRNQGQEAEHSVAVAVRIRPFTIGEIQSGPRRVVSVNGDKLILVNPNAFDADPDTIAAAAAAVSLENMRCNDWAKVFCFDNCFWSYDPNDEGDTYVDQDGIFDALGSNMAEDVVNGISTCCFAYGHTSTGKTHTMFGGDDIAQAGTFVESEAPRGPMLSPDAGLIPRVFLDVVQRVFNDKDISNDTRVTLSFMEIYQEKIRDCLAVSSTSSDLKVREHPALGPYVENLTRVEVESASDVLELLYRGYEERSTASTLKNRHSSRSHAIATLELSPVDAPDPFSPTSSKQTRSHGGASSIPGVTVVHKQTHVRAQMVDLAGSEKESSREMENETTHRGGGGSVQESNVERLELKMIRRSLSTLGYIIKALGQGNSAKGLPFRDSVLTWLLKDALSGHCNVTMLATISPSHTCFDETLHTLKYADRLCRLSVSSLPGKEATGRVGINDTVDPDLTYSLATEYSKLKQELGANKPGTHAARHLLQQTISDPQQRLARLDPYKSTDVGETSLKSSLSSSQRNSRPASAGRSQLTASGRNEFYSSGAVELIDQDLKEAYRQLHGKYVELQIELENARTDRDGMQLELQNMQDALSRAESERFMGSRSAVSDMTIALRSAEEEVAELRGVVMRKEETADRLLSELADERQARGTVEKTARAQVTELIGRLEALHKQGQATAKESQKWQQEASIVQQEKEMVESQVLGLKEELLDAQESAETRISQLEDELRLSMDHVTNAIKERDRTNSEITSVLKEKADMAAREVLLTQRIQELQMEVEKANNESKVKSELEIVKLQRDSLFEIIKQQEQALHMQQQQSEASLKMLHQRQAALDRYEQRSEGEHDELSDLQKNLQSLLANEGQTLYSELIDAKKLIAVIASVREKVAETGLLKDDIARLEDEREAQRNRLQRLEKEHTAWREERSEVMEELEHFKKLALDWETRAQYWQQVSKKASSSAHSHPADSHESGFADFAASTVTRSTEYLDLRSENAALQEKLSQTQDQLRAREAELKAAQDDMQREFSQLWTSVEQLNGLDSAKTKTIEELTAQRDAAVKEKNEFMKKYRAIEQEYEGLQSELQSIDLNLLDVADHEGIEVEDILHMVHDNHPHVPHDISDSYFAKRSRSRSPAGNGRRHADTTPLYASQYRHPSASVSMHDSDAMSEPGYYRSTGASRARSTPGEALRRGERGRDRTSQHRRGAERTPSSSLRRSLADHEPNDEKGLEMQIEELSQFLTHDSSHRIGQRSRLRMSSSRSKS